MQPNALSTCQKHAFFLLSSFNGTPAPDALSVFYKVETEVFAKDICDALAREYGDSTGWPKFDYVAAATLSPADQEHFHIAFARFEFLRDVIRRVDHPNEGDAPLPEEMKMRVQHAVYAQEWERGMQALALQDEAHNLFMQFAQTYYTVLESVIGCPDPVLDLELNTAYRLVVKNIKRIMRDYECLHNFPMRFEPVVSNLCPMTLCNLKWKDVALEVQIFLGAVHEYVTSNGSPKPDSAVEDCTLTVKMAAMYSKRMVERAQHKVDPASPQKFIGAGTATESDAQVALVVANKTPASGAHPILDQIRKNTEHLMQKADDHATHTDQRFDTLGHEFSDMQRENDVLKQDLAQALANLARQVEPEFFQWIFVILGTGSVNAAAHVLKIPSSTFDKHLKAYVARGGLYETLYKMVAVWKKGGGRIQIEQFNETFGKHQGVQAVAEPDVLRDLLDGLEAQNGANWKAVRDELIGIVKDEFPGNCSSIQNSGVRIQTNRPANKAAGFRPQECLR